MVRAERGRNTQESGRGAYLLRVVASLLPLLAPGYGQMEQLDIRRPPFNERTFRSPAVDSYIEELLPRFKDPDIAVLFANCRT
ncbi:hypothetical protein NSK_008159 [Nannochloropsis salina CCMP1776]|uniref:Uncharacterized protein n=1 Tax=Nannochloropsis salina CCMP1776 TaxID=1027361 RepID=A0A4D9CUX1_9STRA|nr:hypothetical protein NSK_008159 [Nannochloropsis salina CCMP1776]|eukprot:TFJ80418.1 hypothetical protein NSK_008159 [Nannochloropsis salina CCMP1776]